MSCLEFVPTGYFDTLPQIILYQLQDWVLPIHHKKFENRVGDEWFEGSINGFA